MAIQRLFLRARLHSTAAPLMPVFITCATFGECLREIADLLSSPRAALCNQTAPRCQLAPTTESAIFRFLI